ncbi:MAG: UvrD-helicase domain-containing protein [Pyrinomonadaceae bacterium]
MRHLINDDGRVFDPEELKALREELDGLSDEERVHFRNENAQKIAPHGCSKILIVSGPGTGKSTIFKQRIIHWLNRDPSARILVLSFVRKLVSDLNTDIQKSAEITEKQKTQIDVCTLHRYARSVVERNHGTSELRFRPHVKIIGQNWKQVVWEDALSLLGQENNDEFAWKNFEKQLHNADLEGSDQWLDLEQMYCVLSDFYNAAGFADLILHASLALHENPSLKDHQLFIVDEYQDFNEAEEKLIQELTSESQGLLIVGDDDQVLYETLKSGKAQLIRRLYSDADYVNAMLPYCSRTKNSHIVNAAGEFIRHEIQKDGIEKIYLPLQKRVGAKVEVIACASASGAVDYIKTFIKINTKKLELRKSELRDGIKKDPFLLILTPAREVKFYKAAGADIELKKLVASYAADTQRFSEDYFRILTYYSLAKHPDNDFTFRKVMHYEQVSQEDITALLKRALEEGRTFSEMDEQLIKSILAKCHAIRDLVGGPESIEEKTRRLGKHVNISDLRVLEVDLSRHELNETRIAESETDEEDQAELEELESQPMSAVELMTIVGAKGLSADHVIIIGFDDVNMAWITRNAFYVALTRARESLHLITALKSGGGRTAPDFLHGFSEQDLEFYKHTKKQHETTCLENKVGFRKYLARLTWVAERMVKLNKD